jgi:hypothetical protein
LTGGVAEIVNAFGGQIAGGLGGVTFGVLNDGATVESLSNAQGYVATSSGMALLSASLASGPLTYSGKLPTFYNVIITGNSYGQLAATNVGDSQTTFGVDPLSSNVQKHDYASVISGVTSDNLVNANSRVYSFGKHAGLILSQQKGASDTWDLVFKADRAWTPFLGYDDPNVVNTYFAMDQNRQATEGVLHQRYAVLNAVMHYDCNRFGENGFCIQFQARATGFGAQATGAGVLNAAYRFADKFRVGAYIDYQAAQGHPNSYFGGGGVQQGYDNATFGGYVGYSENADETGVQARVSGGYNPGKVSVYRAPLGGTEPGIGSAGLNAYYVHGVAGYGVRLDNGMVVTPYAGLQYTDVTRNAFSEMGIADATLYPLSYNSYYERMVTGLFGAKLKAMLTERLGFQAAMGGQVDFSRSANSYGGVSNVPGMEVFGIGHGGAWNGVRPAGMVGVFYDPLPNHRISLSAYTSQQGWSTRTYTTGLLGYQFSF